MLGEDARHGGQEVGFIALARRLDNMLREVNARVSDPPWLAVHLAQAQAQPRRRPQPLADGRPEPLDVDRIVEPHDLACVPGHEIVLEFQDGQIFARKGPVAGYRFGDDFRAPA
jgi:hypothetical protein